ncbi:MAG TPA: SPOR domain-containing protein [Allosphingosinicella sp.]
MSAIAFEAAGAQVGPGGFVEDSGAALNRHLKELADSPRSLSALLGAAKSALDLGDAQAAVTFYARAEEIAPRDGRIKAGIGAAFLAMEQPEPALKFLEEARSLGLPEGVIAADRGLAHDLLGDPVAAQRDYAIAMRVNDNDEVRRRLALSRAISGNRGGALAAIEDQVRRNSPAGRRVRAFVLALTGDTSGATDAVRVAMPAQAAAMQPFFARLPQLRPAERAMAVHFGRFPGDAPPGQMPAPLPNYAALPPNIILGGRPDPNQPAFAGRPVTSPSAAQPSGAGQVPSGTARSGSPQPSGGAQGTRLAARANAPVRTPTATGATAQTTTSFPRISSPQIAVSTRSSGAVQGPPDSGDRPTAIAAAPVPSSSVGPASQAPVPGIAGIGLPPSTSASPLRSADAAPSAQVQTGLPGSNMQSSPQPARPERLAGLASVAATIRALDEPSAPAASQGARTDLAGTPSTPASSPAQTTTGPSAPAPQQVIAPPASTPVTSEAGSTLLAKRTEMPSPGAKSSAPPKPAPPRRIWVQLGGKPDEAALRAEFQRLKGRAPELLGDKAAWVTPSGATSSRLLVGPFKTQQDADLFVGLLDDQGLRATAWTSAEGQEIVKLAAR